MPGLMAVSFRDAGELMGLGDFEVVIGLRAKTRRESQ